MIDAGMRELDHGERVMLKQALRMLAEDSRYLYHVTFLKDLDSIISGGLGFGGRTGDFYAERSKDKLFFTELDGVSYWMSKLEDRANAETDNPEEGWIPVTGSTESANQSELTMRMTDRLS